MDGKDRTALGLLPESPSPAGDAGKRGTFSDYLAIARFGHATKHVFIVPGMALAYQLRGVRVEGLAANAVLGLVMAICIASANYAINEWLDRDFDRYHPAKSKRSAVQRQLHGPAVLAEWLVFLAVGLGCGLAASKTLFFAGCAFALQGLVYNVPPLRTKDQAYLDVISELVNNPLRLTIGWAIVDPGTLPPSSVILAFWLGGAFLMAAKRLSEYRELAGQHGKDLLVRYRASFARYSETSLTVSCFGYAMLSSFFLAIFLIKYRMEYLLLMLPVVVLFSYYLALAMKPASSAQRPEKLFRERGLLLIIALISALFVVLTFVDIPFLEAFTKQQYIVIR